MKYTEAQLIEKASYHANQLARHADMETEDTTKAKKKWRREQIARHTHLGHKCSRMLARLKGAQ